MPLCEASATELNMVLQNFFAELKKKDGTEYEPESLQTMLAALDRFLSEQWVEIQHSEGQEIYWKQEGIDSDRMGKQLNSENMVKGSERTEQTH